MTRLGYVTDDAHGDRLASHARRLVRADGRDPRQHGRACRSTPRRSRRCSPTARSVRDLGNAASREEFIEHYGFIIRENLRVTMPGRVACVHVQQLTTTKGRPTAISG